MENFLEETFAKAKKVAKTIVLPEGHDERIIKAASSVLKKKVANLIIIGDKKKIEHELGTSVSSLLVVDENDESIKVQMAQELCNIRKNNGMTLEKAKEVLKDELNFGAMLVKSGNADGMVAGASHSTSSVLRSAFKIIKTAPGINAVSSFFIMATNDKNMGQDGIFLFSDCAVMVSPSPEQLAEIAILSAKSFEHFVGGEPRIAMLSYSTKDSASGECVEKVKKATAIAKSLKPDLKIEGELQLDSAIVPEVSKSKAPDSLIEGRANVLIFPNLDAGNIGYKLVQRLCKCEAYGPITQGLNKPINDLSRGCSINDIIGVISITAVSAQISGD